MCYAHVFPHTRVHVHVAAAQGLPPVAQEGAGSEAGEAQPQQPQSLKCDE